MSLWCTVILPSPILTQVLVQGRVLRTNALNDLLVRGRAALRSEAQYHAPPAPALRLPRSFPPRNWLWPLPWSSGLRRAPSCPPPHPSCVASDQVCVAHAAFLQHPTQPPSPAQYNLACTAIDSYAKDDLRMAAAAPAVDAVLAKTGQTDLTVSGVADPVLPATEMVDVDRVASTLIKTADFGEDPNRPEIRYATRMPGQASTMSSMGGSGGETARLREMLKDYLETDSICYRVSLETGDPDEALLRRRQDKYYDPLIDWFKNAFGVTLGWTTGLQNVQHSTAAYELCEDIIDSGDHFLRAAVHQALGTTKSTAITLALLFRHISAEQAFNASRVEEEYQIEVNGFVEDGHDTARVSARIQLGAVANLLWLSPTSRPPQPPQGLGPEAVQADMEKRLQRVAARRARDAVQGMLEAEERARRRAAVEGGTRQSPASAPLSAEAKEAAELKWMEEELVALQQQTNRMAAGAGMDLPYPEAGVGDAAAAAAAAESSGKSG